MMLAVMAAVELVVVVVVTMVETSSRSFTKACCLHDCMLVSAGSASVAQRGENGASSWPCFATFASSNPSNG
jgi:hypothetical protein